MTATLPPLLALAQGRRVRLRKAPVIRPKEFELHVSVAALLRRRRAPEWLWWHTPNGEIRDKREAAKLKAMGAKPGVPDFLLISPYGSVRFLELKRRGESLSEDQEAFSLHCIRHGIPYSVARTIDEALAALNGWGCLVKIAEAS